MEFMKLEQIGEGGYGSIYKVDHTKWGVVVLKKLKVENNIAEKDLFTLNHEAEVLKNLRHPNIITLYEGQFDSTTCGLFMEFMKYGSVDDFLEQFTVPAIWKEQIIFDISLALCYLHEQKPVIIHGDLKCQNILINYDFHAKVSDFGLSRICTISYSNSENLLQGTLEYIAPEYFKDQHKEITEKFDVYSYGISVWEIFCQKRAYYDFSDRNLIRMFVQKDVRPIMEDNDDTISPTVRMIIRQCWDKLAEERPTFNYIRASLHLNISKFRKDLESSHRYLVKQVHQKQQSRDVPTSTQETSMFRNLVNGGKTTGYNEPDNSSHLIGFEPKQLTKDFEKQLKFPIPVSEGKTMGHDISGVDFSQSSINPEPMASNFDYFRGANSLEIDVSLLKQGCEIGKGYFGIVYKGTFKNHEVAIKDQRLVEQFSKEKSLASLRNPYIVPVLGFYNDQQNSKLLLLFPLMFMDLRCALAGEMELSCEEKLRIIYHVGEALKFLHTALFCRGPIIHGDVKPGNILLDVRKNARLGDAGLASVMLPDQTHYTTNNMCGTEGYKDPHQGTSKICKNASNDIFSFGIVILQILKWQPAVIEKTEKKYNFSTTKSITLFEYLLDQFNGIPIADIYCNNRLFFDKDKWFTVDSKTYIDITSTALCCIDEKEKRPTANFIAAKLRTLLQSLSYPLYEYDDQNEKCLSCCINTAVYNDSLKSVCCRRKLVCKICESSSKLNPVYCPDHGKVGLHFEVDDCCAFLVSGWDSEDAEAEACFKRDVEMMSVAIEDFASMGLKKKTIHKFSLLDSNYEQIIKNIQDELEEYHGKKPELLIFYYSGHGSQNGKMLLSSDKSKVGITAATLKKNFEHINSKRLLAILDCCYAGNFDVLPDNCDDDMQWQIQMNSANRGGTADMDESDGDNNRTIYQSTFTNCVIAALGSAQYCPMTLVNCNHCSSFKEFVSFHEYIDVDLIYKFVKAHMHLDDPKSKPNMSVKNVQGDTMIAYSDTMSCTFRFIGMDGKETPIYLEKIGSSVEVILKQLFAKACDLGLLTKSCDQMLQLIGNRKAVEYEISTKQDVVFNCLFRGGPKCCIR